MMARFQELSTSIGLLILRLGIGGYMLAGGAGKLKQFMDGNRAIVGDPIGIGTTLSSIGIVFAEFFCAILVMCGLATRFAALVIVFAMAVAAFVFHANDPWTMAGGAKSKQGALMFLIPFLALAFTGAGKLSVDALLWPPMKNWWTKRKGVPTA
jgi:putative oxidoreductase